MANAMYKSAYLEPREIENSFQIVNTDDTTDINSSASGVEIPIAGDSQLGSFMFSQVGNGVRANAAGWVDAYTSVYYESTVARVNVGLIFAVNGQPKLVEGAQGYLRASTGHNEATSQVRQGFNVEIGDIISVYGYRKAAAGVATQVPGKSILILTMSNLPKPLGTGISGTFNENFENGDLGIFTDTGTLAFTTGQTAATPSTGTGSLGPQSGANFVFTEMSSNGFQETFQINTSDFAKLTLVNFWYNMEGANAGTARLQYKGIDGSWKTAWQIVGDQGAVWHNIQVDMSGFEVVEIRFQVTGATDYAGDFCLDNVTLTSVDG